MNKLIYIIILISSFTLSAETYNALENKSVNEFINSFSKKSDFTEQQLKDLFSKVKIKEKVKKSSSKKNQSEFKLYWDDYKKRVVTKNRIKNGKDFIKNNINALKRAEIKYKVPKEIITAIIGIESNYGDNLGDYRAIDSLSTMAFENNPRSGFFRKQVESFIERCLDKKIHCYDTKSSWAGAIGYGQFIPTSLDGYAIDFNDNGKIDLSNEVEDAIGSVAYYLKRSKWQDNDLISKNVTVEDNRYRKFLNDGLDLNTSVHWLRHSNVKNIGNVKNRVKVKLFEIDKNKNEKSVYIGFQNFKAITAYNRSNFYALAVHELSKKIKEN